MAPVELLQKLPTPQCDHVNTYTCAVLAVAQADTDANARRAAERDAKTHAKNLLDQFKTNTSCPGGCDPGAWGGTIQQTATTAYSHVDTANNRWVAYATADWKATLPCEGEATDAALTLPAQAKELRYPSSPDANAPCNKTTVYSGCVIAHALGKDAALAKKAAETKALELARRLLLEDKAHKCRTVCRPGVTSGSDPDNLTVEQILTARLRQATGSPHISYVRVAWNATIWCPVQASMGEPRRTEGVPA